MIRKFIIKIDEKITLTVLLKAIAILGILLLLKMTETVWGSWVSTLISILQPFVIGFVLAYIISPLIEYLQEKGVPKNLSIIVFWIVVIILVIMLFLVLLPMIYDKIVSFLGSLVEGVRWISANLNNMIDPKEKITLIDNVTSTIVKSLQSYDSWLPGIMSSLPGFMNSFLNVLTTTLFSIIIAIYMLFDFDKIKRGIKKAFAMIFKHSDKYISEINSEVTVYLQSLLILMLIKFVEYSIFYLLIGHQDWLIVALLTSIGLIVPYLGGTIANMIGILTALSLDPIRIFFLLLGIVVLSNVDAYVISPMVHEKRSSLGPLLTLFAVFAGGVVYGALGIMVSVPIAIAVKAAMRVYNDDPSHET